MMSLFFGDSATPSYGVLHPSNQRGTPRASAVLCAPIGHEYLQAHRVMRNLAAELADRGISALRFDYTGTGDSSGDGDAVTLSRMTQDVEAAIAEVRALTRARKVVLVALRTGAIPAVRAAVDPNVIGCVLWEPILRGVTALPTLGGSSDQVGRDVQSFGGFPYGPTLQRELADFDAAAEWARSSGRVRVLAPTDDEIAARGAVTTHLLWTRTNGALDFGPPGSQDLLWVAEERLIEVADAVEALASA